MKITFIIQDLFQQGAQYVTALMIRGFISRNYKVDLLLSKVHSDLSTNGDIDPFYIPESTNVIILKDRKARNNILEIRKYLKSTDTQAIIAMSPNYTQALAIASIGLSKRYKLAYVEHSGFIPSIKSKYALNIHNLIDRFIVAQYDKIMTVSSGTASALEHELGLPSGFVNVVYNPVIDSIFRDKISKSPSHPWLREKEMPTFVTAGAHCSLKNHVMLFEAIKIANETMPIRLILFGKGDLTMDYKKWIEYNEMSQFIDIANHTDNLPAELKACDGLLIGSNMESFSIVLVEALAAGSPVISTNCPFGPPELLNYGKFGTLVPVNDANAMSQAILNQVKNPRKAIPDKSWLPYTIENVVEAYENALDL